VIRQQSAIIHNIRLLELHNTLHLKEETPIKVLDICSHENAQMRQELGEMGVKTSQASSEASKLKVSLTRKHIYLSRLYEVKVSEVVCGRVE